MSEYLVAAEVDKIQDLIFRSSRLKQVVGGSAVLKTFCTEVGQLIDSDFGGTPIIAGGGYFLAKFSNLDQAQLFSKILPELYRRRLAGTLSIVDQPIELPGGAAERTALDHARASLVRQKHSGNPPSTPEHMPFLEICPACGIDVAQVVVPGAHKEGVLCESCYLKKEAEAHAQESFYRNLSEQVATHLSHSSIPGDAVDNLGYWDDIDQFAQNTDPKNYVAYLVADGNEMGATFKAQESFANLSNLSERLEEEIYACLAETASRLMLNTSIGLEGDRGTVPILPLIIGGDDIFCLLPARWALDFTRDFIKNYETRLQTVLEDLGTLDEDFPPTMSAGVVLCKATFPYKLAHQIGEDLLEDAKIRAKTGEGRVSTVSIKLIKSSTVPTGHERGAFVQTQYPAFTLDQVHDLTRYRQELQQSHQNGRGFSRKKRADLLRLYLDMEVYTNANEIRQNWEPRLAQFLERVFQPEVKASLSTALAALIPEGPDNLRYWEWIEGHFHSPACTLLEIWDYLQKIDTSNLTYTEEDEQ